MFKTFMFRNAGIADSKKAKLLLVHNHYLQRGGEDESFEAEKLLLSQSGHEVCVYTRSNAEIKDYNLLQTLSLPLRTISAGDSYADIRRLVLKEKPAIAHFNNTFPLISPAAYEACHELSIPVIQNLRNYRLLCPNALFFRDHHICEDCLQLSRFFPWPAVLHACYRDSHVQSTVVSSMLAFHRFRKTWDTNVDLYIALTEFSRAKFVEGGLPPEKVVVRPNFVYDNGPADGNGNYVLFIGRLEESKGLLNLIEAWKRCQSIPLKIAGDGPLMATLLAAIKTNGLENIELCGRLPSSEIIPLIKGARFIVFPSIWYEVFPRVFLESFSCGRSVLASNVGSSSEIVQRGGVLFHAEDPRDLAENVKTLWHNPKLCRQLGRAARQEYETRYTPEIAYQLISRIYERALSIYR